MTYFARVSNNIYAAAEFYRKLGSMVLVGVLCGPREADAVECSIHFFFSFCLPLSNQAHGLFEISIGAIESENDG